MLRYPYLKAFIFSGLTEVREVGEQWLQKNGEGLEQPLWEWRRELTRPQWRINWGAEILLSLLEHSFGYYLCSCVAPGSRCVGTRNVNIGSIHEVSPNFILSNTNPSFSSSDYMLGKRLLFDLHYSFSLTFNWACGFVEQRLHFHASFATRCDHVTNGICMPVSVL